MGQPPGQMTDRRKPLCRDGAVFGAAQFGFCIIDIEQTDHKIGQDHQGDPQSNCRIDMMLQTLRRRDACINRANQDRNDIQNGQHDQGAIAGQDIERKALDHAIRNDLRHQFLCGPHVHRNANKCG